jgi:hypothetical protein
MAIISSRIAKPPNRLVRIREWRFLCGPTCPETLERPKGSRTQSGRPVTKSGAVSAILPCRAVSTPISAVSRVAVQTVQPGPPHRRLYLHGPQASRTKATSALCGATTVAGLPSSGFEYHPSVCFAGKHGG